MKTQWKVHIQLLPYYLVFAILIVVVRHHSFFWDKDVLISRQAYWFIENNFSFQLPVSMDTGFFPALSLLLAFLWKIFGVHLAVGHLLMLPFTLCLIFHYHKFLSYFSNNKLFIHLTLVLLLIDTTLISQVIVVSTDLLLVLFFFMSVNAIIYKKRYILCFSLLALSLTHFRGLMSCAIVFLFDFLVQLRIDKYKINIKKTLKIIPPYIPFTLLMVVYYYYHYNTTGWNFKHDHSPWAGCYERVDFYGFLFNIGILIWRLIDFGRLFYLIILGFFAFRYIRGKLTADSNITLLLYLLLFCALVYFPTMLIYKVLSDHRYIIPVFNIITVLTGYLLFVKTRPGKIVKAAYIILLIGLLTGNLWIYPDKIAKGWASTAAHIPFYQLREKMIKYIEEKDIPFSEIGSDIPNTAQLKYIFLNADERYFPMKDLKNQNYIFYSNIFNNFTDEELDELKTKWILEKEFCNMQVKVVLYKKVK